MSTMRCYTRPAGEIEQTVWVHITEDGYVKMTADNLHDVLTYIGFTATKDLKEPTA